MTNSIRRLDGYGEQTKQIDEVERKNERDRGGEGLS